MKTPEKILAEKLLQISAIMLQPESPFLWATGWNAPIYTDLRRILSYPDVRNYIKIELSRTILEHFPEADAIAGVATGAIAIAAITADCLSLPNAYVRETPKDHGLENMIEGNLRPGSKVVVIDDQIITGGAALNVAKVIRDAGCEVIGMLSIFNFEFPEAMRRFKDANMPLHTLLDYTTMVQVAGDMQYIQPSDILTLGEWRKDPANWTPKGYRL